MQSNLLRDTGANNTLKFIERIVNNIAMYQQLPLLNPVMKTRPQIGHVVNSERTAKP